MSAISSLRCRCSIDVNVAEIISARKCAQNNRVMGLLQLRYEHDSSAIRVRFERDTTAYEELCAFEQ